MSRPSLRTDPHRQILVLPAGCTEALVKKAADKTYGTEARDWTYAPLAPGTMMRPVARVLPIAGNELMYKEAVDLTLERVRATHELGEGPVASGVATVLATRKGRPNEYEVHIVEILQN